jgi:hypothetical protein
MPELSTRQLPPLGDYLPPLDKGRLEVAPPEGWHVPSASSQYVVRVQKSNQEKYPSVTVTAEDYDGQGISDVSEENVEKFAAQVAEAVGKKASSVKPTRIGDLVCVEYAKRGKVGPPTRILDLLYLETVVAGRKFRFELRSEEGSLEEDRPYLYAVVNGARFLEAASQPKQQESPQAQAEPEEKQAEDDQPDKQPPKPEPEETPEKKADEKADQEDGLELDPDTSSMS